MNPLELLAGAGFTGAFAIPAYLGVRALTAKPTDVSLRESRRDDLGLVDYLPYEELIEPNTVLLTYGALMAVYEVGWRDTSYLDRHTQMAHCGQVNAGLVSRSLGWMHQSYTLRVPASPLSVPSYLTSDGHRVLAESHARDAGVGRYGLRHFVVLTYLPASPMSKGLQSLAFTGPSPVEASYQKVRDDFEHGLQSYEDALRLAGRYRRLGTHRADLERSELLETIYGTLYDEWQPIRVGHPFKPCAIGGLLASKDISPAGMLPKVGDKHLRVLSVYGYPATSHPGMMDPVLSIPASGLRYSTRAIFQDEAKAKKGLDSKRRAYLTSKRSFAAMAMETEGRVNRAAAHGEEQVEQAILAADTQQIAFVQFSSKVVFLHEDQVELDEALRAAKKAIRGIGLVVNEERHNALDAYFGHLPGDGHHDVREGQVHTVNVARFWPTSSPWLGRHTWNCKHCGDITVPALLGVTETGEDFGFDPHDEDSQSFVTVGAMGCGKTTDLNTFAANYRRAANDQVFGIDKNRGQYVTTMFLGGDYREDRKFALFGGLEQEDRRAYLVTFLVSLGAINGVEIEPNHREAVKATLEKMLELDVRHRSLSTFVGLLSSVDRERGLTDAIAQYAEGGVHRGIFDGLTTTNPDRSQNSYEVHELGGLLGGNQDDLVAAPVLLWLLHSFEDRLPGHRSIILVDEAWASLRSAKVAALLDDQLRTLRYRHAGIGFYTHSLAEIRKSDVGAMVVTACKTRLLYPNPEAAGEFLDFYEGLALTPTQIARVKNGIIKRDIILSAGDRFGSFRLQRSPAELAVFGCTGSDEVSAARRLIAEYPTDWRERFMDERGFKREAERLRSLRRSGHLNGKTIREAVVA